MVYKTSPSLREEKTRPGSQTEVKRKRVPRSGDKALNRELQNLETSTTCTITERSIGDVWVLRSVKNGVSTVVPLWQNSEVISDGSECQSPETTHFWQGQRLRQTYKINIVMCPQACPQARGEKCEWYVEIFWRLDLYATRSRFWKLDLYATRSRTSLMIMEM